MVPDEKELAMYRYDWVSRGQNSQQLHRFGAGAHGTTFVPAGSGAQAAGCAAAPASHWGEVG